MATAAKTSGRTVRAAVADAIEAAREAKRIQPHHEPAAAVALKVAAALGRPKLAIGDLVRLSGELQKLLTGLPLAPEQPPAKGAGDDGPAAPAGGSGEGHSPAAGLASGVGSGPTVGDTALPR